MSQWDKAAAVILPVPYDLTTSYRAGTRHGPTAILQASAQLEWYDEELESEICRVGIHTLPLMEPTASGAHRMIARVRNAAEILLEAGKFPVLLGGEHSLSLGVVEALGDRFPGVSVLFLDAHSDLRDAYQQSKYSHACVGRRIAERWPLVQVGIRSLSLEEANYLKNSEITVVMARDMETSWSGLDTTLTNLTDIVYISVDLDVLDPSIMPAVGTPEPGGLGWYQVLNILRHVCARHRVVGFDVMELCPISGNVAPDFLAAKLAYRLLGYSLRQGGIWEN
ncbi:MAG: agmatinase [Deltaproteobacteria bacterium]|nr:agmatinase [Deltaproteobacteria bacterium]MBW2309027.1 agmatinase [Deltaproteobacteria bacterium]